MKTFLALVLGVVLGGCSTGIVPAGHNTFMISYGGKPGLRSGQGERAQCYREASKYCGEKGLVMVPIEENVSPAQFGGRYASASLTFKALRAGDPEIQRTRPVVRYHEPPPGPAPGVIMMQGMADSIQRANEMNRADWEARRPRSYRVEDRGFGNYQVTPRGY